MPLLDKIFLFILIFIVMLHFLFIHYCFNGFINVLMFLIFYLLIVFIYSFINVHALIYALIYALRRYRICFNKCCPFECETCSKYYHAVKGAKTKFRQRKETLSKSLY